MPATHTLPPIRLTLTLEQVRELARLEMQVVRALPSAHRAIVANDLPAASAFLSDLTGIREILGHSFFERWLDDVLPNSADDIRSAVSAFDDGPSAA